MKQSDKAILLSVLVFPGAGHYYLKAYVRASVFALVGLAALAVLIPAIFSQAYSIAEGILQADTSPSFQTVLSLVSEERAADNNPSPKIAAWTIFLVWVIGIYDTYRITRQNS